MEEWKKETKQKTKKRSWRLGGGRRRRMGVKGEEDSKNLN